MPGVLGGMVRIAIEPEMLGEMTEGVVFGQVERLAQELWEFVMVVEKPVVELVRVKAAAVVRGYVQVESD
jgi:hypothetical protein